MAILRLNEASISNQKPGQAWLFLGDADVNSVRIPLSSPGLGDAGVPTGWLSGSEPNWTAQESAATTRQPAVPSGRTWQDAAKPLQRAGVWGFADLGAAQRGERARGSANAPDHHGSQQPCPRLGQLAEGWCRDPHGGFADRRGWSAHTYRPWDRWAHSR